MLMLGFDMWMWMWCLEAGDAGEVMIKEADVMKLKVTVFNL